MVNPREDIIVPDNINRKDDLLKLRMKVDAYEEAIKQLIKAKYDPAKLRQLVEELEDFGPGGPVGWGLGRYGGHAV